MTLLMIWLLVLTGIGGWVWLVGSAIWFVIAIATNFSLFWIKSLWLSRFFFVPLIALIVVTILTKMGKVV